jgi:hypothetical protein
MNGYSQFNLELFYSFGLGEPDTRGGVYVDDTWIWIADHKDGLWRANKCDGSLAGSTSSDDKALWDIYHAGNYIYGASDDKILYIYDDVAGQVLGSASTTDVVYGVFVTGNYAYLAGDKGLEVFNISDPYNPSYILSLNSDKQFVAVEGVGDYIYASQYTDDVVMIYNISASPSNPTLVGTYNPSMSGDIRRIHVDGPNNLIYVVNDAADLYIVDVSNPSIPTTAGSILLDGGNSNLPAGGVFVVDNNAIVATANGNDKGYLYWIDVSDPTNPAPVDTLYDNNFGFNEPYIEACFILVAAHDGYTVYRMSGFQPDGLISNIDASNYIGNSIYNSDGLDQTKSQQINYGDSAIYKIRVDNESSAEQQLSIAGQSGPNGWSYIYLDENNVDITTDIQNGTFLTDSLAFGESFTFTLKMVPDETVIANTVKTDTIIVSGGQCGTGQCTPADADVVVAQTTLLNGPGSIGEYVWHDVNKDGIQDVLEQGIANALVYLRTDTGIKIDSITTSSIGYYKFINLAAGTYIVDVKNASLPPYYWTTTNNEPDTVNLTASENYQNANFGYAELDPSEYDPAGYLYNEDTGEIVPGGLISASGPGIITIVKDGSTGEYAFYTNGAPGVYTITLTTPPGYIVSTTCLPLDPPPYDPTGQSNPVILGAGEVGATGFLSSNACTPFYYTFDLEDGDPFILNNNFPLKEILYDFGDAPDPTYPTLSASNGASHLINSGYFLGASVDSEVDGQPEASSLGDDNDGSDDDDGVTFSSPLMQFFQNSIDIVASGNGYINGWMDFNSDGDWDDAGEKILDGQAVTTGTNSLTFQVPLIDETGGLRTVGIASRFRFSSQQVLAYNGPAPDGEVEDYAIDVLIPVELAAFEAISMEGVVKISWSTFTETENMGFHIFRSETKDGQYEKITQLLIPGAGSSENEIKYEFIDHSAKAGKTYHYKLADYSLAGGTRMHEPVKAFVELPLEYSLKQNYPNPFNPETNITFLLKRQGMLN